MRNIPDTIRYRFIFLSPLYHRTGPISCRRAAMKGEMGFPPVPPGIDGWVSGQGFPYGLRQRTPRCCLFREWRNRECSVLRGINLVISACWDWYGTVFPCLIPRSLLAVGPIRHPLFPFPLYKIYSFNISAQNRIKSMILIELFLI